MSENSGFNAIFGGVVPTKAPTINRTYGSFHSQLSQSILIPLMPTPIFLEYTDLQEGINQPMSDGIIYFDNAGIYMIDATLLFRHNSPISADTGYVWYQKGGVDVPETTRSIRLNTNIYQTTLSVSYMVKINAVSDTIQLFFTTSSTDVQLYYDNSVSSIPNGSSAIVNVFQIA